MPRVEVFFYGLFMDEALLRSQGVAPARMEPASVKGQRLHIGRRATLVPDGAGIVHGMLASLTHDDLEILYSAPGLADYRPQPVVTELRSGEQRAALSYTLSTAPSPDEHDPDYAARLRAVARTLDFPADYVASIR